MSGRPFRDPKNVNYIPTLFKDGKRKQLQYTRSKQGRKEREDGEDTLMVAVGLLNMSTKISSCEDTFAKVVYIEGEMVTVLELPSATVTRITSIISFRCPLTASLMEVWAHIALLN